MMCEFELKKNDIEADESLKQKKKSSRRSMGSLIGRFAKSSPDLMHPTSVNIPVKRSFIVVHVCGCGWLWSSKG